MNSKEKISNISIYCRLLTNALVKIVENRGGRVVIGKANGFLFETITTHSDKDLHHQTSPIRATKLLVEDQEPIEADIFILAMGPWTCKDILLSIFKSLQ
jgi:hypothetical protein